MHIPVLLHEAIEGLNLKAGDIFLDATVGLGGHSEYVCKQKGREVKIIALDLNKSSLDKAKERLEILNCNVTFHNVNFRELDKVLQELEIKKVNAILLDLGLSSHLLLESGRGFSFQKDEPLLMTYKSQNPSPHRGEGEERGRGEKESLTAMEIVNTWNEKDIADVLYRYGEERFARRIARIIMETRARHPIVSTFELVEVIKKAVPIKYQRARIHFATKTFQALRIAVNDELDALRDALHKGFEILDSQGRLVVISFHSIEDRIVKHFYKEQKNKNEASIITKKPVRAGQEELRDNPRARSAKLRILQKI